MKRFLISLLCIAFILCIVACGNRESDIEKTTSENASEKTSDSVVEADKNSSEEGTMKLLINDLEIPVIWEENASVDEIMAEAAKEDIVISMSMYSDFEQVGSLGKKYSSNDKQITTQNGDIVLYNSSNIVVFYGSNSWSYTRLGEID